ncbi:MAG: phosphoglucosamine mutase [Pseudohongiellaceae bacterium]
MSRTWFGTDGIRGKAGTGPLATPFLVRLGLALGEQAKGSAAEDAEHPLVLLARDTRESGPAITVALSDGLCAAGANVIDLGVLPTPGLAMAMRSRGAQRGVVVSASHNPWEDNGVKVFGSGGHKLTDDQEHALEARVEALGGETDAMPPVEVSLATGAPQAHEDDGVAEYVDAVLKHFEGLDLSGFTMVIDCAHGAASVTAPAVLRGLGAKVTVECAEPNGRNINDDCGSTHLDRVATANRSGEFDLGLAFDGDADRVLMVDALGRACTGDHMLGLLGCWLDGAGRLPNSTVVATVMSNLGLQRILDSRGIRLLRTAVGDRYVKAAMREGDFGLGGEDSGHLLFGAEHEYTGDGLYTGLRVLEALIATKQTLAQVIDSMPVVPQVLLNVPVQSRPPVDRLPALQERVARAEGRYGNDIRIVLRYSGTERLARVMVEGLDKDTVDELAAELSAVWTREIEIHGPEGASTA